jgi:nicotinate-nucleotide adenylyltransferase
MAKRKTILFGGTFDPIHIGHTTVAAEAGEYIGAEEIIIIPSKCSPLKETLPIASDDDRLKMIALSIADEKKFKLSDYELKKPGPSYTLETIRWFQKEFGGDTSIYWLIGADSIDEMPHWYGIVELIDECSLSVMYRAGCEQPDFAKFISLWGSGRVEKLQRNIIKTSLIDISSTQIRNRLAAGCDAADMLHPSVADYIRKHDLYRSKAGP